MKGVAQINNEPLDSVSRSHFRLEAAGGLSGECANAPLPVFSLGAECGKKMNVARAINRQASQEN
jgi:hypothetical protein